ncbi:MAG: rubredoxin [Prevotella sp.]|nr:rubredoxin [Prevotella sp.]
MMKYKCSICGYVYDEAKEGVPFAELPDSWQCPLCGAPKSAFEPVGEVAQEATAPSAPAAETDGAEPMAAEATIAEIADDESMLPLSVGQMAALCSNLARGCEKQYMEQESALFNELAAWFTQRSPRIDDATVEALASQLQQDLSHYPALNETCVQDGDRGAQRVVGWGEKATRMLNSLMTRYQREGDNLLADTEIWVCSICGFVYIGKKAPDLCPVCKVPSWRFSQIERRKKS